MSKSSRVRSVTRWPSASRTVTVMPVTSTPERNVRSACPPCSKSKGATSKGPPASNSANAAAANRMSQLNTAGRPDRINGVSSTVILPDRSLRESLSQDGFVFVRAEAMRRAFEALGPLDDWTQFAASCDALELDEHMADGGRYRRRRHAVFAAAGAAGAIERGPHQPHYQG